MNYNKWIGGGNLTRDPELRYTPKGTAICKISVAINRTLKSESGEKKEEVTFIDVDAFGKTAENIGQYFRKGQPILIEGRLKMDSWEDKQSGQKRSKLGVALESFQFVGSKSDESSESIQKPKSSEQMKPESPSQLQHELKPKDDGVDEEIPF
jgi:single-strand DNA-binding protein